MSARLLDIAQQAGVSVSTVSLVLSGNERISVATKAKVLRVAEELGYQKGKRSPTSNLAIVLTDVGAGPVASIFQEAISGVLDESMASSAVLQITRYNATANDPNGLLNMLRANGNQAAVIIGHELDAPTFHALSAAGFPYITVGRRTLDDVDVSWVASDYVQGARDATQHLIDLGHRRIAVMPGLQALTPRIQDRLLGYRVTMEEARLSSIVLEPSTMPTPEQWLASGITAVFALGYPLGASVLAACSEAGIRVPEQLAVVAFDNDLGAELLYPPLTTVRQPMHELGVIAARTLLAWLRGLPRSPVQISLQTKLIVRKSCGAQRNLN